MTSPTMKRLLSFLLLSAVLLRGTDTMAFSTVTAASGSLVDVSNAITAAGFGGTVWIPPGTNQWAGTLTDVGVNLYGSNKCSILFTTNVQIGLYVQTYGTFTTISNLIIDSDIVNGPQNQVIGIDGSNVCFRITACTLMDVSTVAYEGIKIPSGGSDSANLLGPWGVVDHCNFYLPDLGKPYNIFNIHANGYFSSNNLYNGFGWSYPMTWGTTNTVTIESCNAGIPAVTTLGSQAFVEGYGGGRACVRYCNLTNIVESTHGTHSGSAYVGFLQMEWYENNSQFNNPNVEWTYFYLQRGGSSVIWSNVWHSTQPDVNTTTTLSFWVECATATGPCNWICESCPSLASYPANYPLFQQIGQGLVGLNTPGYQPVYMWSNTIPGSQFGLALGTEASSSQFITQGIDIFTNQINPAYTAQAFPSPLTAAMQPQPPPAAGAWGSLPIQRKGW